MAESQKQSPSPVNSKEKDSLLGDVDFGKDFLSSWKTMSMEEGDPMDFDFGTVSKGKKKAFNFDKLDVDFALDGDLDKISSFKVDISDLDITSPPKRAGKSNERSKESGGNHQLKQDRFTLPFDFDELDSFSFESSLMKGGKQSNKNQNSEETSVRSECQGSGAYPTDGIGASEVSLTPKLPSSVSAPTPHIETPVGDLGGLDSTEEDFASNSARNDNGPSKSATLQNEVASEETRILPEKTTTAIIQEKKQENYQQEKTSPPESCDEETMQDLSVQSVSANELIQHTASEVQAEVRSLATKASKNAAGEQGVLCKSVAGLGFSRENSMSENLPAQHIATSPGNNAVGSDNNVPLGYADGAEPAEGDSYSEKALTISVSMEAMHDTKASGDAQNTNEMLHLTPLSSGTTVRKLVQMKEKQTGIFQSKYFMKSDETESQSRKAPSTQAKPTMFGGKRGYGQHGATDEGREGVEARDAQSGSKLVGISRPQSGELDKGESVQPVQLGSRSGVKGLKDVREHCSASGALYGTKMFVSSRTCVRGVMKVEPVQESEKNKRNLPTLSSGFNPSSSPEQTNKSTAQNCKDPRIPSSSIVSVQKSGDVCSEGNKTSPPKSGRSLLDLASLKISRTVGANPQSTKYTIQKEIKSLRNTEQNMDLEGSAISKMAHSVRTEKRTPPTPSLKRKTFEGLNADILSLNPSKRLSPSATDSRNGERTEIVVDKEAGSHKDPADGSPNNAFNVFQTSTPDPLREVNMIELETPLVMENDINVEKAEAYTNELENICNMLKKKHELAKEILVRAIVNNNKLLMLNHPIYEEKIRKIQKFAAQLMSK